MSGADETPTNPTLSVLLTVQNSCPRTLTVSAFTLTAGTWEPQSTPVLGQQTEPGQTSSCMSFATGAQASVEGSLSLIMAQDGTATVTWNLTLKAKFDPVLTKSPNWGAPNIDAQLVTNQGDYAHVWVQLLVAIAVGAQPGETLPQLAARTGIDVSVLARANGLPEDAMLSAGQRLLLPPFLPDPGVWRKKLITLNLDEPTED
jgi:LysM domain